MRQNGPLWQVPLVTGCSAEYCDEEEDDEAALNLTKGMAWHRVHWPFAVDESGLELPWHDAAEEHTFAREPSRTRVRKLLAWGVRSGWPIIERLACDVPLDPGDVLFTRDDVWHRTQDLSQDRLALKIDVLRFAQKTDWNRPAQSGRFDFVPEQQLASGAAS